MYNDPSDVVLRPSELDEFIEQNAVEEFIAGGPLDGKPEFRQHECWRMLHVWPSEEEPTKPGKVECAGCGSVWRFEEEFTP